jgi:PKD repeat protein
LPAGWSTSAFGAQSNWVTSTTSADTAPNAAHSPDPGAVGVNELVSPAVAISSPSAVLSFRHNYDLIASTTNNSIGYDGGVLEIKIGSGSYTDILSAGGSFVTGGYNKTLSSSYSNPLAGRQAWSGNSGGFTTTVVNLPASAAGQNVQLRWRCGAGSPPPQPAALTSSGTLAYWDFDGSNAAPVTVAANLSATAVTVTNLGTGGSLTYFGGNPGTGQAVAASGFTMAAGPVDTNYSCFAFALSVTNGSVMTLSSLSFDNRASGAGPQKFDVQVSQLASFSSSLWGSGEQNWHGTNTWGTDSFAPAKSNLTGTVYFRIYAYKASASGGTWRMDNLNIQGNVGSAGSGGWYVDSVSIQDALCCTYVPNPPVADFTGSPTNGAAPLAVTFTDSSTGDVTNRFWDFGDGAPTNITAAGISHTYAAGTYDVTLIATGPDGVSTNAKTGYITAWTPFQSWQMQYFSSLNCGLCGESADFDGDGQNNLAEFLAGTDPTNSGSAFRVTKIAKEGNNLRVTWTTVTGQTNALQRSSTVAGGYGDIFIVTNTVGTTTNYLDIGAATNFPSRYYRVRLVP